MKNKIFILLIVLSLVVSLCACKNTNQIDSHIEDNYLTFTDSIGNEVILKTKPENVAVCFSSLTDMYITAGGEVNISVGESIERGFVSEDVLLVDSGAGKKIDNELLISYKPDLVIYSADIAAQQESYEIIKNAGINAACFEIDDFDDYLYAFEIMCKITGDNDAYEQYGLDVQNKISKLISSTDTENFGDIDVLYIRCGSSSSATKAKSSSDNFVCRMLKELGVHNIADDAPVLLDGLSLEIIIREDPDYIFFSTMGNRDAAISYMQSVLSESGWSSLTAVKNNNYDFLPKELFQYKPNANWDKAYEYLIGLLNNVSQQQ